MNAKHKPLGNRTPAAESESAQSAEPAVMSIAEAGRKGGQATAARRGSEFYREIGRKGGVATAEAHGSEFYSAIGRKGGESRADNPDVRSGALGRKGAQARWGKGEETAANGKSNGPKDAKYVHPDADARKSPARRSTSGD